MIVGVQCFFPQNIIDGVKTPLFLLNAAYDFIQVNVNFSRCMEQTP